MHINFKNLTETLKEKKMTIRGLERELGYKNGTIRAWGTKGCIPRTDRLVAVSRRLGKPIEFFITEEADEQTSN